MFLYCVKKLNATLDQSDHILKIKCKIVKQIFITMYYTEIVMICQSSKMLLRVVLLNLALHIVPIIPIIIIYLFILFHYFTTVNAIMLLLINKYDYIITFVNSKKLINHKIILIDTHFCLLNFISLPYIVL